MLGRVNNRMEMERQVRGERIIRIAALIILCALAYYAGFEQSRKAQNISYDQSRRALAAKDKTIESLALELNQCREQTSEQARKGQAAPSQYKEITLKPGSSRPLLDGLASVKCLGLNNIEGKAEVGISLVGQGEMKTANLRPGENLAFSLRGRDYRLALSEIQPESITLRLLDSGLD